MEPVDSKQLINWLLQERFGRRLSVETRSALARDIETDPDEVRRIIRANMSAWISTAAMDLGRSINVPNVDACATELFEALQVESVRPSAQRSGGRACGRWVSRRCVAVQPLGFRIESESGAIVSRARRGTAVLRGSTTGLAGAYN